MLARSSFMRLPLLLGLITLGYLTFEIISPFIIPIAWAAVLVFISWPLYTWVLKLCRARDNLAAGIMTLLLTGVLLGPLVWLLFMLQNEVLIIYKHLADFLTQETLVLPTMITDYAPGITHELEARWISLHNNPEELKAILRGPLNLGLAHLGSLASEVTRNAAKLIFTVFTAFFFYRDGLKIMLQINSAIAQMTAGKGERYVRTAGDMTRAVVFGIVLTALAQGALAGLGYAVANAPNPVFLAVITFLLALIPFGTPFAWAGVSLWLLFAGDTASAIGLAIWGALVVSTIDNVIRPLVISSATQISFLVVMFGILGGLASMGMIGLFLGPVILAVALAIWNEWLNQPLAAE